MGWKQIASDYLTFGKRDRAGVLGVLLILLAIYFLPKLAATTTGNKAIQPDTAILSIIDTLEETGNGYNKASTEYEENFDAYQPSKSLDYTKGALFLFDPNTLSAEGWEKLGLSSKTAATIRKYVSKGGSFKKPEDLQKIWGLPKGFYERVSPYIKIESIAANPSYKPDDAPPATFGRTERKRSIVEINSADTGALIALPGIGSKLAYRITNFRDKLGGFYSVDQVKETYGLPDSTFQKIKSYLAVNAAGVRKLNINTATKDELKLHPYIRWNLANAIVEYRAQHGAFKSLDDLKNIILVDEVTFAKIRPYLIL